jgi:hypothetical protein
MINPKSLLHVIVASALILVSSQFVSGASLDVTVGGGGWNDLQSEIRTDVIRDGN